jgi:hypothetical protein
MVPSSGDKGWLIPAAGLLEGVTRNTVLNRLQRAERLLPFSLAGHGLEVGALEIAQWLGTQPGSATHSG